MIDHHDIAELQQAMRILQGMIDELLDMATKNDWKNKFVEQIDDFYRISELLLELGYDGGEV